MRQSASQSSDARLRWRAALVLGLVTSTYSTIVSTLLAARVGRDVGVDWMIVASLVLRDAALQTEPSWPVILTGVAVHQLADLWWVLVFFGTFGRLTGRLRPVAIVLLALPWALATSALEWLLLVPIVPFWQPIFTLEQPYWLGLAVHLSSAALYPLFPWLRDRLAGRTPSPSRRFCAIWSGLAAAVLAVLAVLAALGSQQRELPHVGSPASAAFDRDFMRRMGAHHAQGIELAQLAAAQAQDAHLRALARLMIATQQGEVAIFDQWWRSWFDDQPVFVCSPQERDAMPGMLSAPQTEGLRQATGAEFDRMFVELMTHHHQGAIRMADQAIEQGGDVRIKLMAHAIRHEQRGEIALMRGAAGSAAVALAVSALTASAGASPVDGPGHEHRTRGQ